MEKLTIVKVGGKVVEMDATLQLFLHDFAGIKGYKLLVHGGGRMATSVGERLGIENKMVDGRRVTDAATLDVATMVYGGLVNKKVVAGLQALGINALGLTGADMDVIRSDKRPVGEIDYGFVGDVKKVKGELLAKFVQEGVVPVMAPLTHDGLGNLLNTNADTIAAEVAKALCNHFDTTLVFCFDKKGVLMDENDDESVIHRLTKPEFEDLVRDGVVKGGMIPKLENAFAAVSSGVKQVVITMASELGSDSGTRIV